MWRHRFESCMYRTMPTAVGYVCFIVLFGRKLCSLNGKTSDVGSNPVITFFIFLVMKINYKNQDLKISNCYYGAKCLLCVFNSTFHLHYCSLLCRHGKIWVKDVFNSDIFKL